MSRITAGSVVIAAVGIGLPVGRCGACFRGCCPDGTGCCGDCAIASGAPNSAAATTTIHPSLAFIASLLAGWFDVAAFTLRSRRLFESARFSRRSGDRRPAPAHARASMRHSRTGSDSYDARETAFPRLVEITNKWCPAPVVSSNRSMITSSYQSAPRLL
jgi:hypothetical protein